MSQPTISLDVNIGSQGTPSWLNSALPMTGTGVELRWSDSGTQTATASISWPAFTKPGSGTTPATTFFLYYFTADTSGNGVQGGATPVAFTNSNYLMMRWSDAGNGSWAAAPIMTAYDNNSHNAPTSRDTTNFPNNVMGNSTDTGSPAKSYLKANAYGFFNDTPAGAPSNAPVVTDGTVGSVTTSSASWLTNYQDLLADIDYVICGLQPANNLAQKWYFMLALFSGANMATGVYSNTVVSLKTTWI